MNPGPETGLNARKFGFKARTKYGVYMNVRGEIYHDNSMIFLFSYAYIN